MQGKTEFTQFWHCPELGGLEVLKAQYQHKEFSKHVHEGYCINLIENGAQAFYRSGHMHVAPQGDIVLVNPDEVHTGSSAVEHGWGYRALYPTPDMIAHISQDFFQERGCVPWFPNAVIHDEDLAAQMRVLFDVLEQPSNALFKETLYVATVAKLISRHGQKPQAINTLPDAAHKALLLKDHIAAHPEQEHKLSDLAALVDLSPWHCLRQFKKFVGMPPHAWLIQVRLQRARQYLKQGMAIPQVAFDCGFSDQSHLNRHFKRALGVTPAQYIVSL